MKQFLLITGVLLAWTSCVTAADNVTLSTSDYKSMMQRMDALQRQVNSLGTPAKSRGGSARTEAVETKYDKLAQDMSGIYDTLDVVETKSLQDRINLGAELRVRMDNWRTKDFIGSYVTDPTRTTAWYPANFTPVSIVDQTRDNFWTTRFRLNMDADVSRGLTFHARLAAFKAWADGDFETTNDANRVHVPTDTTIKMDRAYVDWIPQGLPFPLAITFGRQPSSEGPPFEYKDNRKRQSTYPALLFGGESDGIVATLGLERYIKIRNSGLRFFYAKGFQSDDESFMAPYTYRAVDPNGLTDLNVYAVFLEGEIPKMRDSLVVVSYIHATDFNDQGMNYLFTSGQPITNVVSLGDIDVAGFHMQFTNIQNTGLDFFYSYGYVSANPSGNPAAGGMGLLSTDNTTSNTGDSHYLGLKYTLPLKAMKNPQIGFEYNKGSQYWFSFTWGAAEQYGKLATRGDVFDTYYIQPFNSNLFMRIGYTMINYDYTNSGSYLGDPTATEESLTNFYMLLDCRF